MDAIYLDHAATTPLRPEVREAMEPYLAESFGNPSSVHRWGRKAATALEDARTRIAAALGGDRNDFYFVRGGTESDNLAIFGRAQIARDESRAPLVVCSAVDHTAVLSSAEVAVGSDGERVLLPVNPSATIDQDVLEAVLARKPDIVSVMTVNNEVGLRLPVETIAARAYEAGVCMHTDAVQALGKVPIDLNVLPVDLATFTGHKIYGPKSTGLLYKRAGTKLAPRVVGGGQERAIRSGTEDVGGAVGMAVAVELIVAEQTSEAERLGALKGTLLSILQAGVDDFRVHGELDACAPHVLNIGVPGVDRQTLLIELDLAGVAVSSGPACSSGSGTGSHVLMALYGDEIEGPSIRFSLGRLNDEANVKEAGRRVVEVIARTRAHAAPA
jgi:cysteine desulfurase